MWESWDLGRKQFSFEVRSDFLECFDGLGFSIVLGLGFGILEVLGFGFFRFRVCAHGSRSKFLGFVIG